MQALLWLLVLLAGLRLFVALIQVPPFMSATLGLVFSAVFIAIPIIGLYYAADSNWRPKPSAICLMLGIAIQAICTIALGSASGWTAVALTVVAQTGLVLWCFGLGAVVACLIKDKNLLLPVALFLAGFDVFLVTFPLGPVQQVLQRSPEVLAKVAYSIPKPAETGQAVGVHVSSYVGPADFIFLSMFFVALFKFSMRPHRTLPWMIVALVAYMITVLVFGHIELGPISLAALPALLPIGLVILLVNSREFQLKKDEVLGTAIVGLIAVGLAWAGITAPRSKPQAPPAGPSPSQASPIELGQAKKPLPTSPD
ncbi:MAG: hypothetical protein JNK63_06060 [Chthonomonas sp.]|nr:hypothetical protein [Chthonomonas sp.]